MDQYWDWEKAALAYEWLVPWRYARGRELWYQGGYSNAALNLLDRHLETRADDTAIIDRRGSSPIRVRFRDLFWNSARLARWWEKRGLNLGHRVLLYGPADVYLMTAMLALARLGATVVRSPETTDAVLIERVLDTEAHWAVAASGTTPQVLRLQPRLGADFGILTDRPMAGAMTVASAMAEAEGLLDPVPVEANHIGAVVWGDDPAPYAYAGMGSLIGWHQSLKGLLALEPGDRVGIISHSGGLLDTIWLTAAVMGEGCPVVWLPQDGRDGVREYGLTKLVVGGGRPTHLADLSSRLDRIVLFGGGRSEQTWSSRRAEVVRARAEMSQGLYLTVGDVGRIDAPSQDRSRLMRSSPDRGSAPSIGSREQEVLDRVLELDGVGDAVMLPDATSRWHLWLATANTVDELRSQLTDSLTELPHTLRIHAVSALPETVEGQMAYWILQAVQNREPHIHIRDLARPQLVEELVRSLHASEQ